MEDRASVRRQASLQLEAGSHRFTVSAVSPIIADKSLHGKLSSGPGKVLDLRLKRRPRAHHERPSARGQELWDQLREQRELVARGENEVSRLDAALARYDVLAGHWGREVALDASLEPGASKRWSSDWEALRRKLSELAEEGVAAGHRLSESRRRLEDLTRRYEASTTPSAEMEAVLDLTVVMEQTASVELTVEYLVPNALWRPYHAAEWQGDTVRFRSQACLWQNTGEPWSDIDLLFSTERAALGTEPPPLQAELLFLQPKQKRTVVTTRQESVQQVEERVSAVPGIDAGGETLHFAASGKTSVASDGRPHRVPLFEFEAPARDERVLMAELRPEVFQRTRLENGGCGPILAGPVDLIKSCGLVGRGYLDYAAPGQTFSIDWGPHPELRCHREEKVSAEEKSTLSGWRTREHQVEILLSNLGPRSLALEVLERIPVSELKSVRVEQDLGKTSGRQAQDKDGFLRFPVELAPFGRGTVTVGYLVSRKKDVEGL
jgi:uncharacterized protein (TIGR02231 family)